MSSESDKGLSVGLGVIPDGKTIQEPFAVALNHHRSQTDISSRRDIQDENGDSSTKAPDVEVDLENGERKNLKRKPSSIIPRNKRRGLFAQLVIGIPEIDDPVQYSPKTKIFIVFIIATAAIAAPMGYYL